VRFLFRPWCVGTRAQRVSPRRRDDTFQSVLFVCLLVLPGLLDAQEPLSIPAPEEDSAVQAVRRGDYRRALAVIDERLRFIRQRDIRVYLLIQKGDIAATYLRDFPLALRAYDEIVALVRDPSHEDTHLARMYQAKLLCRQGDYDGAVHTYQTIVQHAKRGSIYRERAEEAILRIRDALKRIEAYRREAATAAGAAWAQIVFKTAQLYEEMDSPDAAIREYESIVRRDPSGELAPEAQFRIGRTYAQLKATRLALDAYRKAADHFPASRFDAEAVFQMGRLYLAEGDAPNALGAFDRILADYPTFWKSAAVYYWRAVALEQQGRVEEAAEAYRVFLNVLRLPGVQISMGDIGRYDENPNRLRASVEQGIERLLSERPAQLLARAQAATAHERHAEALALLRTLVLRYPDTPAGKEGTKLLPRCAALAEVAANLELADETQDPIVRARARYRAAELYESVVKDYAEAIRLYEEVANRADSGEMWRAKALYRIGAVRVVFLDDVTKGMAAFSQLVHMAPASPEAAKAYFQMGDIYRQAGNQDDDAIRAFLAAAKYAQFTTYLGDGYEDSTADAAAFRIARVLLENQRRPSDAVAALENFLQTRVSSPRTAAGWLYMSRALEDVADLSRAMDAVIKARTLVAASPVQAQWISLEFPEFADRDRTALIEWMDRRLEALRARTARGSATTQRDTASSR
jgi:tetratricopeptide (TPR) repeat protein